MTFEMAGQIISWWAVQAALGLIALPLLMPVFGSRIPAAYAAAKVIGALAVTYGALLLGVLGVASFSGWGLALSVLALAAASVALVWRRPALVDAARAGRRGLLYIDIVAFVFFVVLAQIRSGRPELIGVEKFMNFAFLNASYYAKSMPPADPWFAGGTINYYYFGHAIAATLTHLAGVPTAVGYNLMMAQVCAWIAACAAALVGGIVAERALGSSRAAGTSGVVAALLLVTAGNGHSFLYGAAKPFLAAIGVIGRPAKLYFYPDSTRFIGFDPPTSDHGFTEFPAYSYAVGDLHAHYNDLPVTLALILVLWAGMSTAFERPERRWPFPWPAALLAGALLGVVIMTNTWDFLTYGLLYALCGAMIVIVRGPFGPMPVIRYGVQGLATAAFAVVVALPHLAFYVAAAAQGITWAEGRTPLWQHAVLFGHLAIVAIVVVGAAIWARWRGRRPGASTLLIVALAVMAFVLLAIPEIARVRDLYGFDHRRANTMFKLSYHAFVMFALVAGAAVGTAATLRRTRDSVVALVACAILLVPPFVYPFLLWNQALRPPRHPTYTLDGLVFMQRQAPDDVALRRFLLDHRPAPGEAMLEASGQSYTYGARLSAATGIPTVLGWEVHEWLWRGDEGGWDKRAEAIRRFYRLPDDAAGRAERCAFLRQFGVRYVIVGAFERERYPELAPPAVQVIGPVVFQSGASLIIDAGLGLNGICAA